MHNCIFCKIINNEIPSKKIWENENFIAILDINPNTRGVTLVIPKKHTPSNVWNLDKDTYMGFMGATKDVVKILQTKLDTPRVGLIIEGTGINHLHAKLYPMHGLKEDLSNIKDLVNEPLERVFFHTYPGYITSQLGPQATQEDLDKIYKRLTT